MDCECGHALKTAMEIDDGQCIRCSSKAIPAKSAVDWRAAGCTAYHHGESRAPVLNGNVMSAIKMGGDALTICRDFLRGWDSANLQPRFKAAFYFVLLTNAAESHIIETR